MILAGYGLPIIPSRPAAPCGAELLAKFGLTNAEPLHLRETDALRFIRDGRWDGIGLDPKFMAEAARLCDHLLPAARATNCSNILIRETDGTITGDFTIGTGTAQDAPRYGADHLPNPCALFD